MAERRTPEVLKARPFSFRTKLMGFDSAHDVKFDMCGERALNRITLLAGNNGCGKSGVLACMAYALSGERPKIGTFLPTRPLFRRVIVVSYGVFRPFKPFGANSDGYVYCGFTNDVREFSIEVSARRHADAIAHLKKSGRLDTWMRVWRELCGRSGITVQPISESLSEQLTALEAMSSGHRVFARMVIDLLTNIEQGSIVLIDEPELHLHPSLISHLMRTLSMLLEQHDSVAIIATHSPVVVQEVPASNVRVFTRDGPMPIVEEPRLETFGSTLSEIVDIVFKMSDVDRNYLTYLTDLSTEARQNLRMRLRDITSLNLDAALDQE
jgi:predicted ATPase